MTKCRKEDMDRGHCLRPVLYNAVKRAQTGAKRWTRGHRRRRGRAPPIRIRTKISLPNIRTGILRFIGMVRYHQRFCSHLAKNSQPLPNYSVKRPTSKMIGSQNTNKSCKISRTSSYPQPCLPTST